MRGVVFQDCDLSGAVFRECLLVGARINGPHGGIVINGFDIGSLIEEELLRRHPERRRLYASTPEEFRDALAYVDELRKQMLARCRNSSEDQLQARTPEGEWSVVENLRHIISGEDSWARDRAFGDTSVSPLGLIPSFADSDEALARGIRIDQSFSFQEVVRELNDRHAFVRLAFELLNDEVLGSPATGWEGSVADALISYLFHEASHLRTINQVLEGQLKIPAEGSFSGG